MNSKIVVVDLLKSRDWTHQFEEFVRTLDQKYTKDKLLKNYLNLDKDWKKFEAFNLMIRNGNILGFSGMHGSPYGQSVSRVLSKLFYSEDLRLKSMRGHIIPSYAARLMLPYQFSMAASLHKKAIFLSFQGLNRRRFSEYLAEALTSTYKQSWTLEPGLYNTAKRLSNGDLNMNADVWQNIIVHRFEKNFELPLARIELSDWEKLNHSNHQNKIE